MRLSHYLKIWPYEEKKGYLLLYSTKKASAALLKKEILDAVEKGTLPPSDMATLQKLGVVVSDIAEEKKAVHAFLGRINDRNSCLNFTVVLNLDCNFACTYCYEGEMKGKLYMTEETGKLLIGFIQARLTEKTKLINIDFYGGEPLLSMNLIKSVSKAVKSFAESEGAVYTFTLVTNGSLFKRSIAEELSGLGLQSIKTTLDGPAEVHDRCRPFKGGRGSFATVVRNMKDTWDVVRIGIGGNFQKDNCEHFPKLLDFLEEEGLTPEKIAAVKFDPVMSRPAGDTPAVDCVDGCMSINEPWLMDASAGLREEILKRGYNTPKLQPLPCQVEVDDYYVVHFDGTIYKCPAFIGRKEFSIGDLKTGTVDYRESHRLGSWKTEDCGDCEYLPLCYGGCRYMSFVRNGNLDKADCKRPYLEATVETMIKQDIKYRIPLQTRQG